MTILLTENNQENAAKAIVVADFWNQNNYQYLLDEKKWVKINKFPGYIPNVFGIHEINNVFYVVGQQGISTLNNEFYKFPSYKCCRISCQVGNNILFVSDNSESKLFNTISKQWSNVNIETKRTCFGVAHYLNQVWIVGGSERDDDGKYKTFNSIQIYDPNNNTFSLSPVKMIQARNLHRIIVYKNKLFVFGGYSYLKSNGPLNSVEMYSPETKKFIMMAPMKIARSQYFACCRVGNLVYVIGGNYDSSKSKSVEIYNLDTNVWCDGTNFLTVLPLRDLNASAVNIILE